MIEPVQILIVEDELLIAHNLARMLKKLGYVVVDIVSSGEKAIQVAAEKQPDLILMDIVIKGQINGVEAAQIIRSQYQIPIVYVTAYTDERTVQRAKETGAYGFVVKPFKKEQLHGTIQVAIGHYQCIAEQDGIDCPINLELDHDYQ
ncbi:response regulator [Pantanalinema rosaneae CENA516]|uniref:response regulator n=1 Tax=Pantanalinema rosaneae TaxID=1620701 RepID=UPI003D6E0E38